MKRVFPLKLNDTGTKVMEAQKYLQKAGSAIKITGVFTIGMYSAVKSFQKKNKLNPTGQIDRITFEKLESFKFCRKIVKMAPKKK